VTTAHLRRPSSWIAPLAERKQNPSDRSWHNTQTYKLIKASLPRKNNFIGAGYFFELRGRRCEKFNIIIVLVSTAECRSTNTFSKQRRVQGILIPSVIVCLILHHTLIPTSTLFHELCWLLTITTSTPDVSKFHGAAAAGCAEVAAAVFVLQTLGASRNPASFPTFAHSVAIRQTPKLFYCIQLSNLYLSPHCILNYLFRLPPSSFYKYRKFCYVTTVSLKLIKQYSLIPA